MTELAELKKDINSRFEHMTISIRLAQSAMGMEGKAIAFDKTEQGDARRKLLRVEKQAIRDKELNQRSHLNYVNSVREMLHTEVTKLLEERLTNHEQLFNEVLGFDGRLPELMDILAVKASSISRIEPSAANMPWLYDELMKLINTPKYRRIDARGKVMTVESLKVALSYLGIENLKMIIPSIALRRSLPQITDPFPEIKVRILEAAVGTAMSCKKLAQVSKVDENTCLALGLMHDLGKIVIVRLFFKLFDEVQRNALIEAQKERKRDEHMALGEIEPSDIFLLQLIEQYAYPLTAKLIEHMNFKRLYLNTAIKEFAEDKAVIHMTPIGKVLAQGVAYNRYRTLKQHKMISVEEAKEYLRQFHFPKGALALLKNTNLRELDVELGNN
jgi:HD-like signal output (HDOD) protein